MAGRGNGRGGGRAGGRGTPISGRGARRVVQVVTKRGAVAGGAKAAGPPKTLSERFAALAAKPAKRQAETVQRTTNKRFEKVHPRVHAPPTHGASNSLPSRLLLSQPHDARARTRRDAARTAVVAALLGAGVALLTSLRRCER